MRRWRIVPCGRRPAAQCAGNDTKGIGNERNQIVVYHPNETVRLDVRLENETVWLNRHQIAQLFGRDVKTVGKHVANALKEELSDLVATEHSHGETSLSVVAKSATTRKGNVFPTVAKFATVQNEGGRQIVRQVEYYNLDVILSVGYRVKSPQGILFRRWANTVLKEYLLRGYSFNTRLNQLEDKMDRRLAKHDQDIVELKDKVDFFVQTSLPPRQGVFYDGQLWDARVFAERLIGGAKKSLVLIDNWATVETVGCGSSPSCAMHSGRVILNVLQTISKSTTSYTGMTIFQMRQNELPLIGRGKLGGIGVD